MGSVDYGPFIELSKILDLTEANAPPEIFTVEGHNFTFGSIAEVPQNQLLELPHLSDLKLVQCNSRCMLQHLGLPMANIVIADHTKFKTQRDELDEDRVHMIPAVFSHLEALNELRGITMTFPRTHPIHEQKFTLLPTPRKVNKIKCGHCPGFYVSVYLPERYILNCYAAKPGI